MTKSRSDAKGGAEAKRGRSGRNSARMIEKAFERLCRAEPADFLIGLYPAVLELVSFVNTDCKRKPEKSEKAFAVLARCISCIYTRIDSGGDIIDCVLDRPMIPNAGNGSYSYRVVAARMRKLLKQCLKLTIEQAITSLPETFRECTWLFCDACGKDQKNRWNLLCLYNDLIADLWGCAKALSGDEETGESAA